jgi:RNA polymerase sigma factor (sigma-70 family)
MREVLIDYARRKRVRRKAEAPRREVQDGLTPNSERAGEYDLEALELALAKLEPRQREVVEHRLFGGLTLQQTADVLGVSVGTVERAWRLARAVLRRELEKHRG